MGKRMNTIYVMLWLFSSCQHAEEQYCLPDEDMNAFSVTPVDSTQHLPPLPDTIGPKLEAAGLIDIQTVHPRILVDLKYASEDNFMQTNVYGGLTRAFLQPEVAQRLGKVQTYLDDHHPGIRLLVYDAVRPRSVQQIMWDLLDSIPVQQRVKFVSNPKSGSLHNYGCAVDLTLYDDSTMQPIDMGAEYDDMRKIAYPELESHFLDTGELTREQYNNRLLLRKAMRQGGFWVIPTEWWHFNAYSRDRAKQLYNSVE
jgi:D-alanyl-D-alanine dipeptidase